MTSGIDNSAEKRAIRLRIGRMRRRVDRRLRAIEREGRLLASWRTWVRRLSGRALLGTAGAELAASAAMRRERWLRAIGLRFARYLGGRAFAAALAELRNVWRASVPKKDEAPKDDEAAPRSEGADRD